VQSLVVEAVCQLVLRPVTDAPDCDPVFADWNVKLPPYWMAASHSGMVSAHSQFESFAVSAVMAAALLSSYAISSQK